jgi:RNA polymerase sigma-70 factor (ECF subfamily)
VENSLCNAFVNLRSFKGQSAFSTWLTRIVINSALMIRRRRTAHVQTSLDEMMDDQPERLRQRIVYAGPDPEELYATANSMSCCQNTSVNFRPPFEMHFNSTF